MTQEKTMDIKAVKFRKDGFYSQPFAFGGEEGQEKLLSRTCQMTGAAHAANSRRRSSIKHETH